MRSLTVPVSFSSLLFPTVPPSCPASFLSFSVFALDGGGSCVGGCWGSVCCARAGETAAHSPIKIATAKRCLNRFCLLIFSLIISRRLCVRASNGLRCFQNLKLSVRFFGQGNGFLRRRSTRKVFLIFGSKYGENRESDCQI